MDLLEWHRGGPEFNFFLTQQEMHALQWRNLAVKHIAEYLTVFEWSAYRRICPEYISVMILNIYSDNVCTRTVLKKKKKKKVPFNLLSVPYTAQWHTDTPHKSLFPQNLFSGTCIRAYMHHAQINKFQVLARWMIEYTANWLHKVIQLRFPNRIFS